MTIRDFGRLKKKLSLLNETQREECVSELTGRSSGSDVNGIPASISQVRMERCPHCQHDRLWKWGYAGDLQRWRCRGCSKTFNALTQTPLARLRKKEKWIDMAKAMIAGESVRETARKCSIHRNTGFRWRHRFLEFQRKAQSKDLSGIAESDTTYFRLSEKGSKTLQRKPRRRGKDRFGKRRDFVAVITLRDRSGKGADRVTTGKQKEIGQRKIFCVNGVSVSECVSLSG